MNTQRDEVRDSRDPGWFYAFNEIVDVCLPVEKERPTIGVYAFSVYMVLCRYANVTSGQCYPSVGTIASHLGVATNTVRKGITTLVKYGLISVEERVEEHDGKRVNTSNLYTLLKIKGLTDLHPPSSGEVPPHASHEVAPLHQVKQGTAPSDPPPLQEVKTNKTQINKTQLTRKDRTTNDDDGVFDPVGELQGIGLTRRQATEVVNRNPDIEPANIANCRRWLAYATTDKSIQRPHGLLYSSLMDGEVPAIPTDRRSSYA